MTDKEIVERAKEAEKRTGFGELVHSPISKGVNSAFGIGFIEGMVEYRKSLQEEPVSDECIYNRTLEERQRSCKFCSAACQVRIKEEPVSIWHDGCEIPKSETSILMIRKEEKDSNYPPIAGCFHGLNSRIDGKNWGYYNGFCYNEIEAPYKWAYVDDFLALEEIPPKFPLISQKKCMYTKDDFTDEDRKVLCDGCEEECELNKEEPVSKDFELALAEMVDKAQKCVVEPLVLASQWKDYLIELSKSEEPVSEELEEAAKNHAVERYRVTRNMVLAEKCKWSFQTGAKWKEKQMMSKAVDAHVNYAWSGLSFGGFDWSKTGLDIGDKCKLIIIKED